MLPKLQISVRHLKMFSYTLFVKGVICVPFVHKAELHYLSYCDELSVYESPNSYSKTHPNVNIF